MKSCIESNFISVAIILLYSTKKHMKYIVLLDLDFSFFCFIVIFFYSLVAIGIDEKIVDYLTY